MRSTGKLTCDEWYMILGRVVFGIPSNAVKAAKECVLITKIVSSFLPTRTLIISGKYVIVCK
jgi:hypothetical protein